MEICGKQEVLEFNGSSEIENFDHPEFVTMQIMTKKNLAHYYDQKKVRRNGNLQQGIIMTANSNIIKITVWHLQLCQCIHMQQTFEVLSPLTQKIMDVWMESVTWNEQVGILSFTDN